MKFDRRELEYSQGVLKTKCLLLVLKNNLELLVLKLIYLSSFPSSYFIQYLICATYWLNPYGVISSSITLQGRQMHNLHFTDEKTAAWSC